MELYSRLLICIFSSCLGQSWRSYTNRLIQMTMAILLLVVAMLVSLVIISIVQAVYVYRKLNSVKPMPTSHITVHKGIHKYMKLKHAYNLCMCVQHWYYSMIMPNWTEYMYWHTGVLWNVCKSMHLFNTYIYVHRTCFDYMYLYVIRV